MKKRKKPNSSDRLAKAKKPGVFLLLSSVLGMLFCVAMLAGTSWAWFTSRIQIPQTITVANFQVTVTITDETGEPLPQGAEGSYLLLGNSTYQISLHAASTASEGYCMMRCGEQSYYTEQIFRGNTLSFTVTPETDVYCSFSAMWGRSPAADIINGGVYGEKKPEPPTELPEETTAPTQEATEPPMEPTEAVPQPTEPTEGVSGSTEPTEAVTEPGTEPPAERPTDATQPTEPATEETEPAQEPTAPTAPEPTEPATASAEPPDETVPEP